MAERKGSHGCCRLRTLAPHPRHRSSSIAPQVLQIGAVKARVWQDEAPRRRGTTRRSCAQRDCAAPLLQLCKLKQPRRAYGRRSRRARHDAPELRAQPILRRCAEAVGIVPGVAENLPMVKIHEELHCRILSMKLAKTVVLRFQEWGLKKGWGDTAEHILEVIYLLDVLQAPEQRHPMVATPAWKFPICDGILFWQDSSQTDWSY